MARPSLLVALAFLAFAGCRDALVDPGTGGAPPVGPTGPTASGAPMYIKGPSAVTLGASAYYRAELVEGAASYQWFFNGSANGVSEDSPHGRWFTVVATQPGDLYVTFLAYDAGGEVVARNEKHVVVSAP